jgi:hypothetical protein
VDIDSLVSQAVTKALDAFQAKLEAEPATKTAGYAVPAVVTGKAASDLTDEAAFKAWLKYGQEAHPQVLAKMRGRRGPVFGFEPAGTKNQKATDDAEESFFIKVTNGTKTTNDA